MKTIQILSLFTLLFSFSVNSQIYNSKDSTFYTDSTYIKLFNGVSVSYYTLNGAVQNKANYINGKLHGEVIEYHENGKISRIVSFRDGKCQGEVLEFHPNGQIAKKAIMKGVYIWHSYRLLSKSPQHDSKHLLFRK